MSTLEDVAQIVAVISAAYPNFSPSEYTVEIYYNMLRDIPTDLLKASVLQAVSEPGRKFAPSVGEIRGIVIELNRSIDGVPSAYAAWEMTHHAMFNGGFVLDEHPLVQQACQLMGGLRRLGESTNIISDRMRYIECYNELVSRTERGAMVLPEVRGYIEQRGGVLPEALTQMKQLQDQWSVTPALLDSRTGERLE